MRDKDLFLTRKVPAAIICQKCQRTVLKKDSFLGKCNQCVSVEITVTPITETDTCALM